MSCDISAALRARRTALGYTQARLCELTGIARPNISRIESGKHTPNKATLARVCAALGCTVESLRATDGLSAAADQSFTKSG